MSTRSDRLYVSLAMATMAGLFLLILLGLQTTDQLQEDAVDLDRTHDVQVQIHRIAATMLDLETSQRGYLLTLEGTYLEPYRAGLARLDKELEELATALAERPEAAPNLQRLRELSDAKRAELARTIALTEAREVAGALRLVRENRGKALMDEFRQVLARLEASNEATLAQRRAASSATIDRNERLVMLLATAIGLLALALHLRVRRERALQQQIVRSEIASREDLEARVKDRTRALEMATQSLAISEGRLHGIFDAAIDAIVTANAEQVIVAANPAAARMFRGAVSDLIGLPLDRLMPERFQEAHRREVQAFAERAEEARAMGVGRREVKGRRLDGNEFALDAGISHFEHGGERLYTAILRDLTQLRRAEAALHASERLLAATFSASSVAMGQIDPVTLRYVAVNESMCRLTGYAMQELLRMGPDDLNLPDDRLDSHKFDSLLRGDAPYREEKRLQRKDGGLVWTEISGSVVRDADGQPLRIVGFLQDITARRQAEETLRAREARQAFLVRLNDRFRDLEDPNALAYEACRMLGEFMEVDRVGYAEDDGNGETISVTHNHARNAASIEGRHLYADYGSQLLAALRAGRTVVQPDIAHDGSLSDEEKAVHAELHVGALVDVPLLRDSHLSAVVFVHAASARQWTADEVTLIEDVAHRVRADIERARAEAEVRRAKARLETALASMNDAVFISDAECRVIDVNDAFVSLHAFHGREDCLRSLEEYAQILEICTPDGTPAPLAQWPVPRALRGEVASGEEYLVRLKDTGATWVASFSFAPIRREDGTIVGSVVSGRDVTPMKQMQAELVAAHATLQHLMANQQRVQEDERKRIARELHDDLQQSLAAIRMDAITVGIRLAKGQGNVAPLLGRIDRLTEAAIASTRRIVSDLRPEMLEELGLVAALEALCTQHAQRSGADCRLEVASTLAAALDGPLLSIGLYRIAQEALNNVARHAQASKVTVQLDCGQSGLVLLRVADNGVGIRPRDEHDPESFGLVGMAERVRALGGHLRIESKAGHGTTIEALVPILLPGLTPLQPSAGGSPAAAGQRRLPAPGPAAQGTAGHPLQTVVDALDGHIAVLDGRGVIQLVNRSWSAFAARHGVQDLRDCGPGVDYLAVCGRSAGREPSAGLVLQGLSAVLDGRKAAFVTEYPCDTCDGVRWFRMHAAAITGGWVIVGHVHINPPEAQRDSGVADPETPGR